MDYDWQTVIIRFFANYGSSSAWTSNARLKTSFRSDRFREHLELDDSPVSATSVVATRGKPSAESFSQVPVLAPIYTNLVYIQLGCSTGICATGLFY